MYLPRPFLVTDGGTGATTQAGAQTNLGVPAATAVMLLNGTQSMGADLNMGSHNIDSLLDPTSAQQAATKNYVDNALAGITPGSRTSVRVATTANISSLTSGAPNVVDGVTLNAGDYVLVNNQTSQPTNGIYSVTTVGTGSNGVWARASGYNTSVEIVPGIYCFVGEGSTMQGTVWMLTSDEPYTLGTSNLVFIQVNGAFDITAGNGLTKTGNSLAVLANGTTITVGGSGISVNQSALSLSSIGGSLALATQVSGQLGLANGGTNAVNASGARSNLSAAPNTPAYWIGATNGELSAGVIPSGGTGVLVTASSGVIAVDTTVVATTTNTLTMSNKTLTSPQLNGPLINLHLQAKTGTYPILVGDNGVLTFNISSAATATLPASATLSTGWSVVLKNKAGSTAALSVKTNGSDTGENGLFTSSTSYEPLTPGTAIHFCWDGSEWITL